MDGPLVRAERAQTIDGKIDTFADSHAGVTEKQQDIADEVVAAQQFLLDQSILFRSQRSRQMALLAGDIVTTEQMGKFRDLLRPGEFFQHAAQVDHIVGTRDRCQWRLVRPQEGEPTEDVGIAAQLFERMNLRILSAEISQKVANCSAIGGDGGITQRSSYRFRGWPEGFRQRMRGEGKTFSFHECDGGVGRMCRATA